MAGFTREKSFERRGPKRSDRPERRESSRFSDRSSGRSEERSFGRDRFERPSGRSFDRDRPSFDKPMHRVICDKCGTSCEVPFKPTSGKPIFCSDCFRKSEKAESRKDDSLKEDIDQINIKLDKILRAMKLN
ncbi:MAG: hypothetical protein Q8O89_06780 [Nanoarchaeota archaeon]|nr:hypothetical protein [Nanoarchaeota archaeon]